ncbi:MAG: response regulator transcription factor [Cytophagaceae bacterium]|jgi:DNA-binding NarL/FixJ family response regulator|nr:response regulator transcription factor [Cytophagaceae bacterium]
MSKSNNHLYPKCSCGHDGHHPPFITVSVVDDHKMITDSLSGMIAGAEGISVIAKAHSVAGCREMLKTGQPDVLLLDVSLPDGNGIDLCPEICGLYPDVKILMLTGYAEPNVIGRALNGGAHGYVLKNSDSEEVIEGIRTVASGRQFLCGQTCALFKRREWQPVILSPKEREVLKLIVEGLTIREISDKLFLGFETVRSYHKYLHLKLGVHNTAQLVRMAIEQKMV